MSMPKNETDGPGETWPDSEPTGKQCGELGRAEEQKWGKEMLVEGLGTVIARGRMLACMHPLSDDEDTALVDAWYEAVSGMVPCQHWKEVGLWASRYTDPANTFTLRQFFQAWAKYCEQGRARGYEPWR
jgi:hypothetical protein